MFCKKNRGLIPRARGKSITIFLVQPLTYFVHATMELNVWHLDVELHVIQTLASTST
jgi:hypothetical protein